MALSQADLALQMIAQLRVLDPSISAELGTPERKIIDTVAEALAEAQVDLTALNGSLDINSKFGSNLDQFLGLFGFGRQAASFATGIVEFSRATAYAADIRIPSGTTVASGVGVSGATQVTFQTTTDAILAANTTSVLAPIQAVISGSAGNVAANTITTFVGTPVFGITAVTNPTATANGLDEETDDQLKVRFKNTVFRNLSGTDDMYLGLVASSAFSSKANVVGPISRYREYIQVPNLDDASAYDINGDGIAEPGNGNAGEWTTALSTIPYSKYIYSSLPAFVSTTPAIGTQIFLTQDIDFRLNTSTAARYAGDTFREATTGQGLNPYTDSTTTYQPNVTLLTVYTGSDTSVQSPIPGQTLLFEHSYISNASRNDYVRNVTNCVDVYLDGGNNLAASVILPLPTTAMVFVNNPVNRFHFDNYRRFGDPDHRPIIGNVYTPLFWQPVQSLPDTIVVNNVTYLLGTHYWGVEDVSSVRGTVRARNGIEWSTSVAGQATSDPDGGPYTGAIITANSATSMEVTNYTYDKNIVDLQAAFESSKQTTTDVLAHKAVPRYFKFDITVMYVSGASPNDINNLIQQSITNYFNGLYFGSTIQLSDILQMVHNVTGVDNVRWSADVDPSLNKVIETNSIGVPRLGLVVDRTQVGVTNSISEIQQIYITGSPTSGNFTLSNGSATTTNIAYNATSTLVYNALTGAGVLPGGGSVTGLGTPESPFIVTWPASSGPQPLLTWGSTLDGGSYVFNNDFFLQDDELPALPTATYGSDSVAGFIIRARAQNTWTRGGS